MIGIELQIGIPSCVGMNAIIRIDRGGESSSAALVQNLTGCRCWKELAVQDSASRHVGRFAALAGNDPLHAGKHIGVAAHVLIVTAGCEHDLQARLLQLLDGTDVLRADFPVRPEQRAVKIDGSEFELLRWN